MNYKKKRLTDAQFQINNKQKFDTKATNIFLKENGLSPFTFSTMAKELVQARLAALELLKNHFELLSEQQIKALNKFNSKVINKKKCNQLNPSIAYPILNLATKIKRQAHKQRYNQP